MSTFDYDLFVIGGGSGGVRAARMSAGFGARVGLAESDRLGGTCVIRGCVPKKLLVYAAHVREDLEDAAGYGWTIDRAAFSWPRWVAAKDREIARLESVYRGMLEKAGVTIHAAPARLLDPHTIEVGAQRVTAKHILIATGGRPFVPSVPGRGLGFTSNEAFHLPELPRRIVILGGGYIAVEFAGIFNGLGCEVTLAYRGAELLRGFDDDVRLFLHGELEKKGIRIRLNAAPAAIEAAADGSRVVQFDAGEPLAADAVMFATGRVPNTAALDAAAAGIELARDGAVPVDAYSRTRVPHVFAIGDVTQRIALTPVAIRDGAAVAQTLFAGQPTPADHVDVPTAVFSQPPIGTVGLTQAQALQRYARIDVYRSEFRPLKHALSGRTERALVKLVVDTASQRVVGVHMVGADAPEIIQGIGVAVKAKLTKADFDTTAAVHPTAAEEFVTLREKVTLRAGD